MIDNNRLFKIESDLHEGHHKVTDMRWLIARLKEQAIIIEQYSGKSPGISIEHFAKLKVENQELCHAAVELRSTLNSMQSALSKARNQIDKVL